MEGIRTRALEEFESVQSRLNNMESSLIAARLESSRASADASRAQGEYDRLRAVAQREELLMREGATARNRYEKAQRDFENAKNEYEGLREIARQAGERVTVLMRDIEAARRSLEEKQASLEAAQNDLAAAEVHAPVDGVLIAVRAKPGDTVAAGTEDLFQIATNPQQLKVTIEPEPDVLDRLKAPAPVLVLVAELPQQPIEGELKSIENGKAIVEFDAPDMAIKPGLTATVRLKLP
jgi:multidrug resistance efflux pump